MRSIRDIGRMANERLISLLSGRPMWVSWGAFTVLSGIALVVSWALIYLLVQRWWVAAIVVIAIGMIWGTVIHKTKELGKKSESE